MASKASNKPIATSSALCRKDLEANTMPPTQLPVEFARKPNPAALAAGYCYGKTKSYTASKVGFPSTNQTARSHRVTREEVPAPKYSTKCGMTAIKPSGNQCV